MQGMFKLPYNGTHLMCFPGGLEDKASAHNAGDTEDVGLIPGSEDPLEESMATHSYILAWRIP